MKLTTRPPRVDVTPVFGTSSHLLKTTVRLHPRRATAPLDSLASKIGGKILWPRDKPWPHCEDVAPPSWRGADGSVPDDLGSTAVPLAPVLQLRAEDFPEVRFYPGTDLFQLLWCPLDHDAPIFVAKPHVYWRDSKVIAASLDAIPSSPYADPAYLLAECELNPERVTEPPPLRDVPRGLLDQLRDLCEEDEDDEDLELYQTQLSVCPATKVGGYPPWLQEPNTPQCQCGRRMEHLLTLSGSEFDGENYVRWCPDEVKDVFKKAFPEREPLQRPAFPKLNGRQMIFICRTCEGWPAQSVFQR
ncbi:MAG TPA: hypothetical protein VGE52_07620 [Pirellulales bacterium]